MIREQTQFAGTLMHREIDLEVKTLEDPHNGNDPVISPGIIRNVRDNHPSVMKHE